MPIQKIAIKVVKYSIVDLKIKSTRKKSTKGTLYGHTKMRTIRCYTTFANTTKPDILTTKKDT